MNNKPQKQKGLDALRGIGIIGIVIYHLFPAILPGGFLGVPLFFVLSGYLMYVTSEASWQEGTFHIPSPFTHLWFLAVEIQFYLLWPFVFLLYKKMCQFFEGRKCFLFLLLVSHPVGYFCINDYHPFLHRGWAE